MSVGVDDVEEADDVGIVHFFKEGNFADCGGRYAFVFGFEADLFKGDDSTWVAEVTGFVNYAIGTCDKAFLVHREGDERFDFRQGI